VSARRRMAQRVLVITAVSLFAVLQAAGSADAQGDAANGGEVAKAHWCHRCHGETGISGNPRFPNLAGQKEDYLIRQLFYFRAAPKEQTGSGEDASVPRAHRSMGFNAKRLSTQDINDLAAFYSSQACAPPAAEPVSPPKAAEICVTCHDMNGKGVADHVPTLAGQNAVYLRAQLELFRESAEGDDTASHKDWRYHQAMSVVSKVISEQDAEDLANYFSRLPCE